MENTGIIICPICGLEFTPYHKNQKYCCETCKNKVKKITLRRAQYKYYLKNKKKFAEKSKKYYQIHKEQIKSNTKTYYQERYANFKPLCQREIIKYSRLIYKTKAERIKYLLEYY